MTTLYVFVLVFVMPSGDMQMATQVVTSCPSQEKIVKLSEDLKARSVIKDLRSQCLEFKVPRSLHI